MLLYGKVLLQCYYLTEQLAMRFFTALYRAEYMNIKQHIIFSMLYENFNIF